VEREKKGVGSTPDPYGVQGIAGCQRKERTHGMRGGATAAVVRNKKKKKKECKEL